MFSMNLSAALLVAITVVMHALGLAVLLSRLMHSHFEPPTRLWPVTWLLIRMTWWLILIHLAEISVWGLFHYWQGRHGTPLRK